MRTTGSVPVPARTDPAPGVRRRTYPIALRDPGETARPAEEVPAVVEFVAHIDQNGPDFTAYGYLTRVAGLPDDQLFAGAGGHGAAEALFTWSASGGLRPAQPPGGAFRLDIDGQLAVYQRAQPGAAWSSPDSFADGAVVARYGLRLHDVLSVVPADDEAPTLQGDVRQTAAQRVGGRRARFGRVGTTFRFRASGDPGTGQAGTPIAALAVAGQLSSC